MITAFKLQSYFAMLSFLMLFPKHLYKASPEQVIQPCAGFASHSRYRTSRPWLSGIVMVFLFFLSACGATLKDLDMEMQKCLQPGSTTLADAVLCLGVPSHSYEDGRILVYPGIIDVNGTSRLSYPPCMSFEIDRQSREIEVVLTFDDHWRLKNYQLVRPIDF
jgi:hypothetical protein